MKPLIFLIASESVKMDRSAQESGEVESKTKNKK